MSKRVVKILDEFELDEISTVDTAAQQPARIVLVKRAPDTTLGTTDSQTGAAASPQTTGSPGGGQPQEKSMTKNDTATPDAVAKQLEAAQAELVIAKAYGGLSDAEKKYCATLPEAERSEFIQKDAGSRDRLVQKSLEADAVVYTSPETGEAFRKSDDPRLVRLAKQADEANRLAKAEREARENERLEKRASDELGSCPGEVTAKVALLKALGGIPDAALRAAATAILKAGNDALAKGFHTFGANGSANDGGKADAETRLEALAKSYSASHKVSLLEARDRVLDTDEGIALVMEMRS